MSKGSCEEELPPGLRHCRHCGRPTEFVYCGECDARCPHGNKIGECERCDVDADLAYDTWREDQDR